MKCVVEKIKNLFWRRKTDSDESELRFHPLTPIDNIEDHKIYQDALEFSLQQDAVKNIAVTGPMALAKAVSFKVSLRIPPINTKLSRYR